MKLDIGGFEEVVQGVLKNLPKQYLDGLKDVVIRVEEEPLPHHLEEESQKDVELYGLFEGIPVTDSDYNYRLLPNQIFIFRGPHIRAHGDGGRQRLLSQVRTTVLHEVGHHFGIDDLRLKSLGLG